MDEETCSRLFWFLREQRNKIKSAMAARELNDIVKSTCKTIEEALPEEDDKRTPQQRALAQMLRSLAAQSKSLTQGSLGSKNYALFSNWYCQLVCTMADEWDYAKQLEKAREQQEKEAKYQEEEAKLLSAEPLRSRQDSKNKAQDAEQCAKLSYSEPSQQFSAEQLRKLTSMLAGGAYAAV